MGMTFRADELSAMQSNAALLRASNSSWVNSNVGLPAALLMLERPAHSWISVIKFAFPSGMAYPSIAGLLERSDQVFYCRRLSLDGLYSVGIECAETEILLPWNFQRSALAPTGMSSR
jgi:hypothetical protein